MRRRNDRRSLSANLPTRSFNLASTTNTTSSILGTDKALSALSSVLDRRCPHTVRRTLNNIQAEQASKQQDLEMGKKQESKKGKRQDPKTGKERDSEKEDRSKTSGKYKDKEKPYGLGTALPHQAGSQPVSQHRPTHSLATDLPHQEDEEQGRISRRKPQRKATVESPEETKARERQQA